MTLATHRWPVITYGVDYSGLKIGEGTAKEGMEQPVYYWDPVIAPSGMVFYTGDAFPGWKGSVLIGSMQPGALVRLELAEAPPSSRGIASEASPPNAASPMPLPGP